MSSVSSKKMKNFKKPEVEERLAAASRCPEAGSPDTVGMRPGGSCRPALFWWYERHPPAMPGVKIAYSEGKSRKNSLIR